VPVQVEGDAGSAVHEGGAGRADVGQEHVGFPGLIEDVGAGAVGRQPVGVDDDVVLVIVEDDTLSLVVGDGAIDRGGQVNKEVFVRLVIVIAVDGHAHGLGRLAGREGERTAGGHIIVVRRRGGAVSGGVVHGDRLVTGVGEGDREDGGGGPVIAFR